MFREQGRIKTKHVQQKFIAELFRGRGKLCSTEIDKSEYTITEQKDEGDEVTYDVPTFNASNVFEFGRNNPDVSYERAYMATSENKYNLHKLLTI